MSAVMAKLRDPESDAWDERWRAVAAELRRIAGRLADPAEADDLAQEAIVRALASPPDDPDALRAYARRTLIRLWLDGQRRRRRRLALLRAFRPAAAAPTHPAEQASQAERVLAARRALDGLSPLQRAALTLRLGEGLSHAQIAAALGTTPAAVRSSLHRARRAVRQAVEGAQA